MWADNTVSTTDFISIKNFLSQRSASMYEYISGKKDVQFSMWYKSLMHSDLTTRGKRTNSTDGFERNLLYYLSEKEMDELQKQFPDKKFECAKQSNIGMPDSFYEDLGVPRIKRRKGKQTETHSWISMNEYMDVFLVNDSLEYFSLAYSQKVMQSLDKEMPSRWQSAKITLDKEKPFTAIDLHQAVHGLGIEADTVFHALRLTMFLNDTLIFVMEHSDEKPKLFILLEKNPMFYYLLGLKDKNWADMERIRRFQERAMIKEGLTLATPEKLYENEWDNVLLP